MRVEGLTKKEIQAQLKKMLLQDEKYSSGKILSSMCTSPHSAAKKAHMLFLESNLGDPGLFPGTLKLERAAISSLNVLLHNKNNIGYIVSGGTEANFLAMYAAREKNKIDNPEVIVPESAHFSFDKICNMLQIRLVSAEVDKSFRIDTQKLSKLINKNTIGIVGNAGSSELGVIDPIEILSQIALDNNLHLHVDAALGGLVIPFLKDLGSDLPDFDFKFPGVQSLTVDPHKMGMSTIPAGGILFRDNNVLECIKTETSYLNDKYQYTFVGTRSGASIAATWAVFETLGREGFKKIVAQCMKLTTFLYEGLEALGFEVLLRPTMNILAFRCTNAKLLVEELRQKGWHVSYVRRLDCIRIIIMPHNTKKNICEFLKILKELQHLKN